MVVLIIIGIILVLVVYGIWEYNNLVRLKEEAKNAWAQIDVQLKRRADLIPSLVNTVKGYVKHEKNLLTKITELRSKIISGTPQERVKANNILSDTLKSLFAVVENYPDLKANQNFLALQEELVNTENKVAYARQAYNDAIYSYNVKVKYFPSRLIASLAGFKEMEYLEVEESAKAPPKIEF